MLSIRSALLPFFLLALIIAASANADSRRPKLRSAFLGPDRWEDKLTSADINRQLKDHFREVLEVLDSQEAASLAAAAQRVIGSNRNHDIAESDLLIAELRQNRKNQIARLREYMAIGIFPLNQGQAEAAVPIFVDDAGTHCAVGYLMHRDAWDKQVSEIVQTNNLVYIPEIQSGPFLDWVAHSGLTREEAALIQPGYSPPEIQVTLQQMQTTMPTLVGEGYVVSGLNVEEVSFFGGHELSFIFPDMYPSTAESAWEAGRLAFATNSPDIAAYRAPAEVGLHLGSGVFVSPDFSVRWENSLESWLFFGPPEENGFDLGQPTASNGNNENDSIMFRMSYNIESLDQPIGEFALSSNPNFNFNWGNFSSNNSDSALRVLTRLYSGTSAQPFDTNLIGELELAASGNDFELLGGIEALALDETQLHVETYAMAYKGAVFTSLFHEFEPVAVPEPSSALLAVGLVGCLVRRRRRT